jgi:hypothetical protein
MSETVIKREKMIDLIPEEFKKRSKLVVTSKALASLKGPRNHDSRVLPRLKRIRRNNGNTFQQGGDSHDV